MKAAIHTKYGLPGDLHIEEYKVPVPKADEILIRVHASTVNRSDCHVLSGKPFPMRFFTGLFKPRRKVTGSDFAGEIAGTGNQVSAFKKGDQIMGFGGGFGGGCHAAYFILTENRARKVMVLKPGNISFETAACLEAAFYASAGILSLKPKPGQKALVYGATGGIGSAYVQFLKYSGTYVTAVCEKKNFELVRSMGADKLVDYKTEDFTMDNERYDYVFDAVGKTSFKKCKKLLKEKGFFTSSGGAINLLLVPITRLFGGKRVVFFVPKGFTPCLTYIRELMETENFKPLIDRRYPLEEIRDAFVYVASGQKLGNVIITMKN